MGNFLGVKVGNLIIRLLFCKKNERSVVEVPPETNAVLLLLVPGTLMVPSDYLALRRALLEAGCSVVTCSPDWQKLDVSDFMASASRLIEAAMEDGLKVIESSSSIPKRLVEKRKGFGRYKKLIVCLHSLSGVVGSSAIPLRRAAGTILLASSFSRAVGMSSAMREFPFPLLSIFGEYDGQHHLCKVAIDLCNSGLLFERRQTYPRCSFAMVDRCNHASFSNQQRNIKRGDLSLDGVEGVDQAMAMGRVASLVRTFAAAHGLSAAESDVNRINPQNGMNHNDGRVSSDHAEAAALLHKETQRVCLLLAPFLRALGRIPEHPMVDTLSSDIMIWKYAYGAEITPGDAPPRSFMPRHPGELAVAERFACQAQEYVIGGKRSSLIVTATVHTEFTTFLRSKVCERVVSPAGVRLVDVQCFLFAAKGTEYSHVSPMYALKLKSSAGLDFPEDRRGPKAIRETPSPVDMFNDLCWARAQELCPSALLARFNEHGTPLRVKEQYHCIPPLWATSESKLSKDGLLTLDGFDMNKLCGEQRPEDIRKGERDPTSIAGVLYYKVPSVAWCLEFMITHSLRIES